MPRPKVKALTGRMAKLEVEQEEELKKNKNSENPNWNPLENPNC